MTHSMLARLLQRGRAHRPVLGAHRGASARAPENTLAAFRAALDDGAELIELDVHLTADGALAVIHDVRTERTTGQPGVVGDLTMAELRRRDAGCHWGAEWSGEGIPELGDVLAVAQGRMLVNVEVKGGPATVPVVARRVAAYDMLESVVVSSFDAETVRAASSLATVEGMPPLLTGLLWDGPLADPVAAIGAVGASLLHMEHTCLTAEVVEALHAAGLGVLAWTVNAPAEMRRLAALGVDAILSDDPHLLSDVVGGGGSELE